LKERERKRKKKESLLQHRRSNLKALLLREDKRLIPKMVSIVLPQMRRRLPKSGLSSDLP
jgi:hypothetical protein